MIRRHGRRRLARAGLVVAAATGLCVLAGFGDADSAALAAAASGPSAAAGAGPAPTAPAVQPVQAAASDPALARVVELTNAERRRAGAPPLVVDDRLDLAARRYAAALAGGACFAHDCGPVPELTDRVGATGYAWARLGENLAAGQRTAEAVVAAWLASPGHRATLLDPALTELGLGRADGGPAGDGVSWVWVQVLAAPAPGPTVASGGEVRS